MGRLDRSMVSSLSLSSVLPGASPNFLQEASPRRALCHLPPFPLAAYYMPSGSSYISAILLTPLLRVKVSLLRQQLELAPLRCTIPIDCRACGCISCITVSRGTLCASPSAHYTPSMSVTCASFWVWGFLNAGIGIGIPSSVCFRMGGSVNNC